MTTGIVYVPPSAVATIPDALLCVVWFNNIAVTITNKAWKVNMTIWILLIEFSAVTSIPVTQSSVVIGSTVTTIPATLLSVVGAAVTSPISNLIWIVHVAIGITFNSRAFLCS